VSAAEEVRLDKQSVLVVNFFTTGALAVTTPQKRHVQSQVHVRQLRVDYGLVHHLADLLWPALRLTDHL
jgi:hypothetical protein